jgi:hypothetical protein
MHPPVLPRPFPHLHLEQWTDAQWATIPTTQVPTHQLIPSQQAVDLTHLARILNERPSIGTCRNCGYAITTAPTSTGWSHDNESPIWQGVRCPNRLLGAAPAQDIGRAIHWQGDLYLYDGHHRWVIALLTGQATFPVRIVEV